MTRPPRPYPGPFPGPRPHGPGPLDQEVDVGVQGFGQGRDQVCRTVVHAGTLAERLGGVPAQFADGKQPQNPVLACISAHLGVHLCRARAELAHVPESQERSPLDTHQVVHRGTYRLRIRVVRVVHEPGSPEPRANLQPAGLRAHGFETTPDLAGVVSQSMGRRRGRQGIDRVVPARQVQGDTKGPEGTGHRDQLAARAVGHRFVAADVGIVRPEGHYGPVPGKLAPEWRVGVVRVDHGSGARSQALEKLALGVRHAFDAAETLEVGRARHGHDAHVWRADGRHPPDLPGVIGTHFEHGAAMLAR